MELRYIGRLHGRFFRFEPKDVEIDGFNGGYVDIEVDKRSKISIHGLQYGASPSTVMKLKKLFDEHKDEIIKEINSASTTPPRP